MRKTVLPQIESQTLNEEKIKSIRKMRRRRTKLYDIDYKTEYIGFFVYYIAINYCKIKSSAYV